jgi:hypothetical protein
MTSSLSVPSIVAGPPKHSGTPVVVVVVASADWINIGDNGRGSSPTVIMRPTTRIIVPRPRGITVNVESDG